MDKAKIFQIMYVIMIIAVITAVIYLIVWISSESASCMKDPLQFYAEKIGSNQCYCLE